jgi:hypothetical protein
MRARLMASAVAGVVAFGGVTAAWGDGPQGPRAVACWGYNGAGECNVPGDLGPTTAIAGGGNHTIALRADGTVRCWGRNDYGQCTVPGDLGPATAIAGGLLHTIALRADGTVRCWGWNAYGQCNVSGDLGPATAIAGGYYHTIALRADGTVRCWGRDDFGQCNVPGDLGPATAIAGGGEHTIALRADGTVRCWGRDDFGQCNVPGDLGPATAIAGGEYHTIALRADGTVRCWGRNDPGQCDVPGDLGPATAIAGGGSHTIALRADGTVRCWGFNGQGQCTVPSNVGNVTGIAGGLLHTVALWNPAALNLRTGIGNATLASAILAASNGDTLLCAPSALAPDNIDFRGKSIELRSTNAIARGANTTTLFANGARLSAPESIALAGTLNIPTGAGISLASEQGLSIGGNAFVSLGGSILAQNDGTPVALTGDMVLATDSVFNALSPVSLSGTLDVLGGVVVSNNLTTTPSSDLVVVNGTIDVGTLTIGGNAASLASAIVSDVSVQPSAQLAASGQVVGDLANAGRTISTDDFVVVGDVLNNAGGAILAQVGVLYITGDLVNNGLVYGNVITAPGFKGGGTGGTQPGDGIRVAGTVSVGPQGELRFVEELWKFSVCGDMALACEPNRVRFNGAELAFDGCGGKPQELEATSADLGCEAGLFEGEVAGVSLFGELSVKAGTTVRLVDAFDNAQGKGAEVIYTKGLTVAAGATLITDGAVIYTLNANIDGSVDDPSNICEVEDLPSPDINGDGAVNGIDLAYVLTYWGTSAAIADINRDGLVAGDDLATILANWTP